MMKRKHTRDLVVFMSGIPSDSTLWDLSCIYRTEGLPDIGSHYVIEKNGEVTKTRPDDTHGLVDKRYNKHAVFIELLGQTSEDITNHQESALAGVLSVLSDRYLDAQPLELFH
jgi:hypothetical protein|tara:strand:+ start:5414 stop:5752 length:339 start_codon:yes stop_codon:yes gene_type:complete